MDESTVPAAGEDDLSALLGAVALGDRRAFARLYAVTGPRMLAIALRIVRRRDVAEDVLQEAFLVVWTRAAQWDGGATSAFGWLATIVRHRAIDRLRADAVHARRRHERTELEQLPEMPAEPAASTVGRVGRRIDECLAALAPDRREAVLLAYYYGLSHEELAARLAAPLGTVKSRVRRGLAQLRECLQR
ncbi:MAG: sigma-70 family RNA polymerase sigma factor [Ectothiorhodospiraceae bacterium]|nr:sigma-70 family RNA polymerase sigma factor [Ectothiorhodospiraceae bacterium]